jgi:hypothetical protein
LAHAVAERLDGHAQGRREANRYFPIWFSAPLPIAADGPEFEVDAYLELALEELCPSRKYQVEKLLERFLGEFAALAPLLAEWNQLLKKLPP